MKRFKLATFVVICLVALFTFSQFYAQDATDQDEAQRLALTTVATEITNGNFDILNQYLAESYVVHTPLGDMDQEALTGLFMAFSNALTDFTMDRDHVLVEGKFAATRLTFSGNFDNDFVSPMGVFPPTGEPFALEIINIFQFDDDGLIAEEWVQYDTLSFFTQLGAMGDPAESASGSISEEMAANFVTRFDAIFDGPNIDIADEIFAPDFVAHLPLAPQLDRDGWKNYAASFYAGISDLTEEVNQVIIGQDRLVLHVTYTGTHDGTLLGIPATGNSVTINGIGIFRFDENGLAAENWAVLDVGGLLAQIGAFPAGE
jgi:predicted ester cyclase